jgi:hypothetical protein
MAVEQQQVEARRRDRSTRGVRPVAGAGQQFASVGMRTPPPVALLVLDGRRGGGKRRRTKLPFSKIN